MCIYLGESNLTEFTGYKVARKINGKYYPPVTGIEYKIGKIPAIRKPRQEFINPRDGWVNVLDKKQIAYTKQMRGKTMVFNKRNDTALVKPYVKSFNGSESVLLKITLSGNLIKCAFVGRKCIAGSHIKNIEEVKK